MDGGERSKGPIRGRYGITRDPDGSLSVVWGWPWFWRYPAGLAGLAASVWFGLRVLDDRAPWVGWIVGGVGVFVSLTITYELLVLLLGALVVWWLYESSSGSGGSWASALGFGAACFLVVGVYHLLRRSDDARRAMSEANGRLIALERRLEVMHRELWRQGRSQAPDLDDDF